MDPITSPFDLLKSLVDYRFSVVCQWPQVESIVNYFSKMFHEGLESRESRDDLKQESWLAVWYACAYLDPIEHPGRFIIMLRTTTIHNWLAPGIVRYHRAKSRNLGKDRHIGDNPEALERLVPMIPSSEKLLAAKRLASSLEDRITAENDPNLVQVYMALVYPGPDVEDKRVEYLKKRGWSSAKRTPDLLVAECIGMTPKNFSWYKHRILAIASDMGLRAPLSQSEIELLRQARREFIECVGEVPEQGEECAAESLQ